MPRIRAIAESLPAPNPVRRAAKVNPRHPASKLYTSPDGGSVRLAWSPANETWLLLWPGDAPVERQQVLDRFQHWEEGDREAKRITERASVENPKRVNRLTWSEWAVETRKLAADRGINFGDLYGVGGDFASDLWASYFRQGLTPEQAVEQASKPYPTENPGKPGQHRYLAKLARMGRIPIWADSLEKAQRAAGAHAYAYRTTVESVEPDPEDPEPSENPVRGVDRPFQVVYDWAGVPFGQGLSPLPLFADANRAAIEVVRSGRSKRACVLYVPPRVAGSTELPRSQVLATYRLGLGGGVESVPPEAVG
jgi:hypothetical protein